MNKQLNCCGYLTKLSNMFNSAIQKSGITIINSDVVKVEVKTPTKFGYSLSIEQHKFDIVYFEDIVPLKWGFYGDVLNLSRAFGQNSEFVIPDVKMMNATIKKTRKKFKEYIQSTLALIALNGYEYIYLRNERKPINFNWKVDDSCISPNGGVSHILVYPEIQVGKLI